MAQHARVEEISDSDSDPSDMDPTDYDAPTLMENTVARTSLPMRPAPSGAAAAAAAAATPNPPPPNYERYKTWTCLYPVYFDRTRSRAEGRRVTRALAVANPLAGEIVEAASRTGLRVFFEPGKTHPKDWANPGRVKVQLKEAPAGGRVKNSEFWGGHPPVPLQKAARGDRKG